MFWKFQTIKIHIFTKGTLHSVILVRTITTLELSIRHCSPFGSHIHQYGPLKTPERIRTLRYCACNRFCPTVLSLWRIIFLYIVLLLVSFLQCPLPCKRPSSHHTTWTQKYTTFPVSERDPEENIPVMTEGTLETEVLDYLRVSGVKDLGSVTLIESCTLIKPLWV